MRRSLSGSNFLSAKAKGCKFGGCELRRKIVGVFFLSSKRNMFYVRGCKRAARKKPFAVTWIYCCCYESWIGQARVLAA